MKKRAALGLFLAGAVLCGCADSAGANGTRSGAEASGFQEESELGTEASGFQGQGESGIGNLPETRTLPGVGNLAEAGNLSGAKNAAEMSGSAPGDYLHETQSETVCTQVTQGGPYGRISLSLPDGWLSEEYSIDSGNVGVGKYGICFYPEGADEGYIEVCYTGFFGVCGMGLKTEDRTLAGKSANVGTYDNAEHWDFITFHEDYEGVVALTFWVDGWWEEYGDQVFDILDTLSFDPDEREGGAYVDSEQSELSEIGLYLTLKNISAFGATLVWNCYDPEAATGELQCGDDFLLQSQKDGQWVDVPVVLDGEYGFHATAHPLPAGERMEQELNWEWLYGRLAPGEYRIGKSVLDFRGSGDYDKYMIYAQFILN